MKKIFTKFPVCSSAKVLLPFSMEGHYNSEIPISVDYGTDGYDWDDYDNEVIVNGFDETDCIEQLIDLRDKYGQLVWYTGVTDDYYIDGERRFDM